MRKTLMEACYKPTVKPQCRLNPLMMEVVRKEVLKLLNTDMIYVIGVHCCIILYHLTMLYVNKNGVFIDFLSYFSGPLFNGEEGPNLEIFKELKKFFRSPQQGNPNLK